MPKLQNSITTYRRYVFGCTPPPTPTKKKRAGVMWYMCAARRNPSCNIQRTHLSQRVLNFFFESLFRLYRHSAAVCAVRSFVSAKSAGVG